jgi:sodium-dependent phosphate transporter
LADPSSAIKYDNTKDFTWIMVFGAMLAFFAAYGIGANDVANSFSSSVGSKSLTMPQAVVLAMIFEFLGAVLMGSSVSQTMRSGIADPKCYVDNPGLFMYGMTIVCMMVGIWLILASYMELPVSTTHSAVGGIIGMTMMSKGVDCVIWNKETTVFPFFSGVSAIVFSWIWSPLVSGLLLAIS